VVVECTKTEEAWCEACVATRENGGGTNQTLFYLSLASSRRRRCGYPKGTIGRDEYESAL
jgi:hypothetical protein